MTFSVSSDYRLIKQGDPHFTFSPNGITLVPRASFEIGQHCPREYKLIIQECMQRGWLKPVAALRGSEYTMELLKNG
jgi:hypothetical protein